MRRNRPDRFGVRGVVEAESYRKPRSRRDVVRPAGVPGDRAPRRSEADWSDAADALDHIDAPGDVARNSSGVCSWTRRCSYP